MTATSEDQPETHWHKRGSRTVYRGRSIISEHDVALPTGQHATYEVDESVPFAAAVLIVDENDMLCLAGQYRYPLDRWIYDLPGGAGEDGEQPMDAAARECREEAGLEPVRLEPLYSYAANPGRSAWAVHLFFCRATTAASADLSDPTEQVRTVRMTIDELDGLIRRDEIVDPSLLIARALAGMRGLLPPLA